MTDLKPFCIKIHQFGKMLLFKKCVGCALTEVKRKRKVDMRTFLNSGWFWENVNFDERSVFDKIYNDIDGSLMGVKTLTEINLNSRKVWSLAGFHWWAPHCIANRHCYNCRRFPLSVDLNISLKETIPSLSFVNRLAKITSQKIPYTPNNVKRFHTILQIRPDMIITYSKIYSNILRNWF